MRPRSLPSAGLAAAWLLSCACAAQAQGVKVEGLNGQVRSLTMAELAALPRGSATLKAEDGRAISYEGVALTTLLQQVGAPSGKGLRGPDMADVVLVSADDGYRVAFGLAETDPSIGGRIVVLADRADGAPLSARDGPFRLVVQGDGRPARAVRMVTDIRIVRLPAASDVSPTPPPK